MGGGGAILYLLSMLYLAVKVHGEHGFYQGQTIRVLVCYMTWNGAIRPLR